MLKRDSVQLFLSVAVAAFVIVTMALLAAYAPLWIDRYLNPPTTPKGFATNPPKAMADFTLTDQNGKPFNFSELRGSPVLMFFGYTYCPDVCPVTMSDFRRVKVALGDKASHVKFVMVSFDGNRDTPEVIKRYVEAFDPTFIGLTGKPELVAKVSADYGAFANIMRIEGTQAEYQVAHSSFTYLIDQNGNWVMTYPVGVPTDNITKDVQKWLP
ncbi:MAG: SCO family protein [Anaerolineae bacterium]|nr:SCO family protein [Anaerolineae bacterium]